VSAAFQLDFSPKHTFRWPRAFLSKDMPVSCLTIACNFPCRTKGDRSKCLSWFTAQNHAARILPCGCAVCILCGNLLMFEHPRRKTDKGRWTTMQPQWVEQKVAENCGQRVAAR